jgi:hypothetical protein
MVRIDSGVTGSLGVCGNDPLVPAVEGAGDVPATGCVVVVVGEVGVVAGAVVAGAVVVVVGAVVVGVPDPNTATVGSVVVVVAIILPDSMTAP